jgi:hypothetical protein
MPRIPAQRDVTNPQLAIGNCAGTEHRRLTLKFSANQLVDQGPQAYRFERLRQEILSFDQ